MKKFLNCEKCFQSIATRSTPVYLGHAVLYLCPFKDKHFWFQIFKTWISCAKIKLYEILRGYIVM